MPRRGRLSVTDRRRIACLYWVKAYSPAEVAGMMNVSRQTVRHWADRWHDEGEAGLEDRPYPKRKREPRQLPAEVEQAILELHAEHPEWSISAIAEEVTPLAHPDNGRSVTWATVYGCLKRNGIHRPKRLVKMPEAIKAEMRRLYNSGMNWNQVARAVTPMVYPDGGIAVSPATVERAVKG